MDEKYLIATTRYIERNPVKAGIVKKPGDYKWSSSKAHLKGEDDILVKSRPLLDIIPDWHSLLSNDVTEDEYATLRSHERAGRPLGSMEFIAKFEKKNFEGTYKAEARPEKK